MVLGQTLLQAGLGLSLAFSQLCSSGALVSQYPSAEVIQQGEVHCGIRIATFQVAMTHRRQVDHDRGVRESPVCMYTIVSQGRL